MTLPEIVLPEIVLPFAVPLALHPCFLNFLIALPVVILLLELMNLMMRKKAVGGVSFFLLILAAIAAAGAYFAGLADTKELYPILNEVASKELMASKLLGTYLFLIAILLLVLKLFAMTGNKFFKTLYILVLIAFVMMTFQQAKKSMNLVYTHGYTVKAVKVLDAKIVDLEKALDEANKVKTAVEEKVEVIRVENTPISEASEITAPSVQVHVPQANVETISTPVEVSKDAVLETTGIETATPSAQEQVEVIEPVVPSVEVIPSPQ